MRGNRSTDSLAGYLLFLLQRGLIGQNRQQGQEIDRPEIQKFVGALIGKQAQKGLFITTGKFSAGALKYADNLLGTKVVLVDGTTLMTLMINHNLGVSLDFTYEIKKIDMDFFEDDV